MKKKNKFSCEQLTNSVDQKEKKPRPGLFKNDKNKNSPNSETNWAAAIVWQLYHYMGHELYSIITLFIISLAVNLLYNRTRFWNCWTHGECSLESTAWEISHQICCWAPTDPMGHRGVRWQVQAASMDQSPWKARITRPGKTTKPCVEWNNYWCQHYSSWYASVSWLLFGNPFYSLGTMWVRTCSEVFH